MTRNHTMPAHGDRRRYSYWKCRCEACRDAARIYQKRRREKRAESEFVDPTGTMRRVQGLVAMGYTYPAIAATIGNGTTFSYVYHLARIDQPRGILRRTAESVRAATYTLLAQPPPTGRGATYARTVARRYGWQPLGVWDDIDDPADQPQPDGPALDEDYADPVRIEQVIAGERPFAELRNDAERAEVVGHLMRRGHTRQHISSTYGLGHNRIRRLAALAAVPGYGTDRQETRAA